MSRRKKTRSGMFFVFLAVTVILVVMIARKSDLESKLGQLMEDKERLEQDISGLEEEEKKIEEYRNYVNSDKYIEDIARNKLGLIYPDEYVFEAEE